MKKLGIICIALVLALGSLGVGYAAWTDTIAVSGTVTTGSVAWEFTTCSLLDEFEPADPGGDYPTTTPDYTTNDGFVPNAEGLDYWKLDKNVGWGEQLRVDSDGDGDYDTLEVTLNNVYPSYFNTLAFYVRNIGTVPLKIDHVNINGTKVFSHNTLVKLDLDGDTVDDFEIWWGDSFGVQIEPGERGPEISFWMHVLQPCPQNMLDELHFTIQIVGVQWNEYPLPVDWEPNDNGD